MKVPQNVQGRIESRVGEQTSGVFPLRFFSVRCNIRFVGIVARHDAR